MRVVRNGKRGDLTGRSTLVYLIEPRNPPGRERGWGPLVLGFHRQVAWSKWSSLEFTFYPPGKSVRGMNVDPSIRLFRWRVGCKLHFASGMIEVIPWVERYRGF